MNCLELMEVTGTHSATPPSLGGPQCPSCVPNHQGSKQSPTHTQMNTHIQTHTHIPATQAPTYTLMHTRTMITHPHKNTYAHIDTYMTHTQ